MKVLTLESYKKYTPKDKEGRMKPKVTGEEKHYQKLNKKLTQELKNALEDKGETFKKLYSLHDEIKVLREKLKNITEENEFLRSKLDLTPEQAKELFESTKHLASISNFVVGFGKSHLPRNY